MVDMVGIVHENYEKITDNIMWLNSNWILKFTVVLNRYHEKYGRMNYHKEIAYRKQGNLSININREFDYYLSIESVKRNNSTNMRDGVNIRNTDIYFLCFKLNEVNKWFTSDEDMAFARNENNRIFIPHKPNSIIVNLSGGKYIEFEPRVKELDNGDQSIGLMVYISNNSLNFFMSVDMFLSFKYFIENFNMYQSAQLMLNYIGRPAYGTGLVDVMNGKNDSKGYATENGKYIRKGTNGNTKTFLS